MDQIRVLLIGISKILLHYILCIYMENMFVMDGERDYTRLSLSIPHNHQTQ